MFFADGTIQRVSRDGQSVIDFPDGQREVHTDSYSQRRCAACTTFVSVLHCPSSRL